MTHEKLEANCPRRRASAPAVSFSLYLCLTSAPASLSLKKNQHLTFIRAINAHVIVKHKPEYGDDTVREEMLENLEANPTQRDEDTAEAFVRKSRDRELAAEQGGGGWLDCFPVVAAVTAPAETNKGTGEEESSKSAVVVAAPGTVPPAPTPLG